MSEGPCGLLAAADLKEAMGPDPLSPVLGSQQQAHRGEAARRGGGNRCLWMPHFPCEVSKAQGESCHPWGYLCSVPDIYCLTDLKDIFRSLPHAKC